MQDGTIKYEGNCLVSWTEVGIPLLHWAPVRNSEARRTLVFRSERPQHLLRGHSRNT